MTAVSRVFAIPELLENILLHLPERRLLLAQRFSKSFRDVTTASVRLQRKLFFTADIDSGDGSIPILKWNPLLDIFRPANSPQHQISNFTRDWYVIHWCQWLKVHKSTMGLNDFIVQYSVQLDWMALKNANHPSASWKRMFFTQPALREMRINCLPSDYYSPTGFEIEDVTGIEMGLLLSERDWKSKNPAVDEFWWLGDWGMMLMLPRHPNQQLGPREGLSLGLGGYILAS